MKNAPTAAALSQPPRRKRTWLGWLLRGSGWILLGVVLVGVGLSQWPQLWRARRIVQKPAENLAPAPPAPEGTPPKFSAALVERLARSTVLIQTEGAAGVQPIGTGMVVSPFGLVATCLHVSKNAVQGSVRFRDGAVYEIAGYAAVAPAYDLALLQLKAWPSDLKPVTWADAPPEPLAELLALGHPRGVEFAPFDGKVSLVLRTSQLPAGAQRFVRDLTQTDFDHEWIQHTARLSDGNSGGPLADASGNVVGMNTWVDRATGFSYALPASAVRELLARSSEDVAPLDKHATPEARLAANVAGASAERLKQLALQLRQQQWKARDRADYRLWQRLAWSLTLANASEPLGGRSLPEEQLTKLQRAADPIAAELRAARWDDIGQITLLNEFAVEEIDRPLVGLAFFGSVERLVEDADSNRAAIVRVAGFERRTIVPLSGALDATQPGDQALFLGVNDHGRDYRYGDNPLQPIIAPRILAPVVITLGRK